MVGVKELGGEIECQTWWNIIVQTLCTKDSR